MRNHRFLFLALFLGLAGCQLVGLPRGPQAPEANIEPSGPLPAGAFTGFLEIEGGRINGILTLTPSGGYDLDGLLEADPDFVAVGQGSVRESEFRLELSYEGACPGKMTLEGRWEVGPGRLSGTVQADDCTGRARGTFLFSPDLNSFFPVGE